MDERAADLPPHLDAVPVNRRADLRFLALLILLTVGLRAWQLTHTEVAARDSIGYIRIAWNLEHGDWPEVVKNAHQHPAYPVAVRAMSIPVRLVVSDTARAMQLSAQLVSALASVLLVVPLYYLGRELFARNIAFWGVLLFQCLPSPGRIMADGLSEPLFLLFAATALVLALVALRKPSLTLFSLAGLVSGLAYLTRPEGLLVAGTTGLILVAQQGRAHWRRPWPVVLKCGTALTLGTVLLCGPFMLLIGGLSLKDSTKRIFKNAAPDQDGAPWLTSSQELSSVSTPQPFALWWAKSDSLNFRGSVEARRGWGLLALGQSLVKGMFFITLLPALVGLWVFRDRFQLHPGTSVLVLLSAILLFALYRVAVVVGYLSDRHLLLFTMIGCIWAAAGTVVLGRWCDALSRRPLTARTWGTALLTLLCAGPALKSLETLHGERAGFREAGYWLAQNAQPGDALVDPFTWTSYYAGRLFDAGSKETKPAHEPPVQYVILDDSPSGHKSHLAEVEAARKLAQTGHEVRRWLSKRGEVAIYEVPENKN